MNQRNLKLFNVVKLEELLANPELTGHVYNPYKIFRVRGTWDLLSKPQSEKFRLTIEARELHSDYTTTSYGAHSV